MSEPLGVIWRGTVLPHESCWNILSRLAHNNYYSLATIQHLLWPPGLHASLYRPFSQEMWGEKGLQQLEHIARLIHLSREQLQQAFLTDCVRDYEIEMLVHPMLRFCTECAKQGYHSSLHQLLLLERCPIHAHELTTQCPNCHKEIGYGFQRGLKGIGICNGCNHRFWIGERAGSLNQREAAAMDGIRQRLLQRKRVLHESMLFKCNHMISRKWHALPSWQHLARQKMDAYRSLEKGEHLIAKREMRVIDLAHAKLNWSPEVFTAKINACLTNFSQVQRTLVEMISRHHPNCLRDLLPKFSFPWSSSHPYCAAVKAYWDWNYWFLSDRRMQEVVERHKPGRSLSADVAVELAGVFLPESLHLAHIGVSSTVFRQELLVDYYGRLLGRIDAFNSDAIEANYGEQRFFWYLPHWLVVLSPDDDNKCLLLMPEEISLSQIEGLISDCPCENCGVRRKLSPELSNTRPE